MSQNWPPPSIYEIRRGGVMVSGWEDTPKWMFWKPTKRRLVIPAYGKRLYEYQHPAFVAREALEKYCAQTTNSA